MRQNPANFGTTLVEMYNHQRSSAYGLSSNDPVWADIRFAVSYFDGKNGAFGSVWRFSEWASFIESQNYQLGPLALESDLSQGAYGHTTWMTSHATYAHSIGVNDPASAFVPGETIQGFGQPNYNNPDRVQLGSEYNGAWAEDIGYLPGTDNALSNTYDAWKNHTISDAGFYQRAVFYDTMGYIIDWGNGSHTDSSGKFHPAYGHLVNLLASDSSENQSLNLAGSGPHNKEPQYLDAIGIDYYFFQNGDGNPNDGLATSWVSTHRLAMHVPVDGGGGYAVAFAYADLNGDGFYTPGIGEGPQLTYDWGYSANGIDVGGGIIMTGTNYGAQTIDYFQDVTLSVGLSANGRTLGHESVPIRGRNFLVTMPVSSGFGLTDGTVPTLAPDANEPNNSSGTATYVGSFSAQTPLYPYTGLFSIAPANDTDWYAFDTTSSGGNLHVDIGDQSSAGIINGKVYRRNDAGGLDLVTTLNAAGDEQTLNTGLNPGRYYLEVYGVGAATNYYSLSLGVEWPAVAPQITSPAAATLTAGSPGTFNVTTTGSPSGAIGVSGTLPDGVTLTDNHDGTATLSSSATAAVGTYQFSITADNGAISTQPFTLAILTPHQRFVEAVYSDVLGRSPDAEGLAHWAGLLDNGTAISSVAASIAHSDEYYANFVIVPAYQNLLGRTADADGVHFWTAQMRNGLTDQQIEAQLVAADEFYQKAGGNNPAWIDAVYKLLLGRSADDSGQSYWSSQLDQGQSRLQVAERIAGSQENNTQLINADYEHYLSRPADSQGLAFWLGQFADGRTNEDVVSGFTGSDEYYNKQIGP